MHPDTVVVAVKHLLISQKQLLGCLLPVSRRAAPPHRRPLRRLQRRQHRRRLERRLRIQGCVAPPPPPRLLSRTALVNLGAPLRRTHRQHSLSPTRTSRTLSTRTTSQHPLLLPLPPPPLPPPHSPHTPCLTKLFPAGYEYFDVWAPEIATHYGQVFWTDQGSTPIPPDVVKRFDGKVMAIMGEHQRATTQRPRLFFDAVLCRRRALSAWATCRLRAGPGHRHAAGQAGAKPGEGRLRPDQLGGE